MALTGAATARGRVWICASRQGAPTATCHAQKTMPFSAKSRSRSSRHGSGISGYLPVGAQQVLAVAAGTALLQPTFFRAVTSASGSKGLWSLMTTRLLSTIWLCIMLNASQTLDHMRSSTGRRVSGEDSLDRRGDLGSLRRLIQGGNHVLLTGQRRMGKTSIAQELGRRLGAEGRTHLFCDVEAARCPEDVITEMANAAHSVHSPMKRFRKRLGRWLGDRIEEIGVSDFRAKVRAGIDAGNWKRHGGNLLRDCADRKQQVLLVLD